MYLLIITNHQVTRYLVYKELCKHRIETDVMVQDAVSSGHHGNVCCSYHGNQVCVYVVHVILQVVLCTDATFSHR